MSVRQYYKDALAERGYEADAAQLAGIDRLQRFSDELQAYERSQRSLMKRWFSKEAPPEGVYLWGGVGRGKSFLMDAFYRSVPIEHKTRLHFHEFMRSVHQQLNNFKGQADPLEAVAQVIADRYRLICFDEFHVSDIADAMILYKLLLGLYERGVCFVMTSNYPPDSLYPDGLHRDRILPAIALIKSRMNVLTIDTGVDYRRRSLEQVKAYFTPLNDDSRAHLQSVFDKLSDTAPMEPTIEIENRTLPMVARSGSVAWFGFDVLCEGARSQNDYLDLVSRFQTVILSDVPRMTVRDASAARRFTWLVDVLYDHQVKLIISAECEPDELYVEGPMASEFHRTVSRLVEMQSKEYLESERRSAVTL